MAKRKCGFAHAATVTYSCNICDFSDCNVVSIGYVAVFFQLQLHRPKHWALPASALPIYCSCADFFISYHVIKC